MKFFERGAADGGDVSVKLAAGSVFVVRVFAEGASFSVRGPNATKPMITTPRIIRLLYRSLRMESPMPERPILEKPILRFPQLGHFIDRSFPLGNHVYSQSMHLFSIRFVVLIFY